MANTIKANAKKAYQEAFALIPQHIRESSPSFQEEAEPTGYEYALHMLRVIGSIAQRGLTLQADTDYGMGSRDHTITKADLVQLMNYSQGIHKNDTQILQPIVDFVREHHHEISIGSRGIGSSFIDI